MTEKEEEKKKTLSTILENRLFLSGEYSTQNIQELKSKGITAILNCTTKLPNHFSDDFSYLNLDLIDDDKQNIESTFEISHKFIKENDTVLIHCQAGVSRSPTIVISYLMKYEGYNLRDAMNFVKKQREIVFPNVGFVFQLIEYEKKILNLKSSTLDFSSYLCEYFFDLFDDKMSQLELKQKIEEILKQKILLDDIILEIYNL
eukprot:gene5359-9167_t